MKYSEQTKSDSANLCNDDLVSELTDFEACISCGGFRITNDTNRDLVFFTWGEDVEPRRRTLNAGESGSYNQQYVLYDRRLGPGFVPTISQQLSGNASYRFSSAGNQLSLLGGSANITI
jgi:hypothetical protein